MNRLDLEVTEEWWEAKQQLDEEKGREPEALHYTMYGFFLVAVPIGLFAAASGMDGIGLPGFFLAALAGGGGYLTWRDKHRVRYAETCRRCESLIAEKKRSERAQ